MKKIILHSMLMLCVLTLASAQTPHTIDDAVQGTGLSHHTYVGAVGYMVYHTKFFWQYAFILQCRVTN